MLPEYKLIRFSNGDQIIGEVLEERDFFIRVRNMFKVISRETRQGYVTGVVGWLSYVKDEVVVLNKEHVTFTSSIDGEIVDYIKNRKDEDDEVLSVEDMERQYKEAMMDHYLRIANTNPTMN